MNINKYIKNIWVAACILMGGTLFNSCTDELDGKSVINTGTEGINLTISVDGMREKVLTRAEETSERTDKSEIHDLHIVLADGDNIVKVINIDASTATSSTPSEDDSGIVSTTEFKTDFNAGEVYYHISQADAKGFDHVYVVANYIDESGAFATFPITEGESVSALQDLKQGYPSSSEVEAYCTMYGDIDLTTTSSTGDHSHTSGATYEISLKRTLAMITVGINAAGMRKGVIIRPTGIKLVNVPKSCWITKDNAPASDDIEPEGPAYLSLNWDALATHDETSFATSTPEEPHSMVDGVIPLFMFENKQGKMETANTDQTAKEPPMDKKDLCTYIEVFADYEYRKELDTDNSTPKPGNIPTVLSGTITYRLYLGEDVVSDFNVIRNKHYQLTLNLKDWAGLKEDGKITDGNIYVDGNTDGVGWRVDTNLQDRTEGFTVDAIDLPIGGSVIDVVAVTNDMQIQVHYNKNQFVHSEMTNWFYAQSSTGEWVEYSKNNPQIRELKYEDNHDGTLTLHFYAKPWTYNDIKAITEGEDAADFATVADWIEKGYRSVEISLKNDGDPLVIRQWLPLPVLEPEIYGNNPDINTADPTLAKLYYSRVDIAHGAELRWGPAVYDNVQLTSKDIGNGHGELEITGLGITNASDSYAVDFTPEYGFHNQVAFFVTDQKGTNARKAINFEAVLNGSEYSIMDWVTFISANAEDPGTGETEKGLVIESAENATGQHHYALASKEEWGKIEKYGVVDPKFSLLPVPYWTSNMEGTKSYVYIYGNNGKVELRDRSEPHRGRMVYHKNNEAKF